MLAILAVVEQHGELVDNQEDRIGYLLVIDAPPTEINVVKFILDK